MFSCFTYRLVTILLVLTVLYGCGNRSSHEPENTYSLSYPSNQANKESSYSLWGEKVSDPYRWLEDVEHQKVLNWAQAQNQTTFDYISQLPARVKILKQLEELMVSKEYKKAKRDGDFYFYTLTLDQPDREIVYYTSINNEKEKVFVDPQRFSGNENARFASLSVSPDSKYGAFSLQDPLSKKEKIFIKNLEKNQFLSDIITASYNSTICWDGQGGFFYNKGFAPAFSKDSVAHSVFYHVPGENPSRDIPVFLNQPYPRSTNDVFVSSNQRFVIIRSIIDKNNSEIRYTDLFAPPPNTFKMLTNQAGANPYIVDNLDDKLIVLTYRDAPKGKVVIIDPKNPEVENWQTLIPESQDIIQRVYSLNRKFYVRSSLHMLSKITAYDSSGTRLNSIELPGNGIVEGFAAKPGYSDVLYTYQSYNYPLTIFKYNVDKNRSDIFKQTERKIEPNDYVVKKEFCLTEEGIGIPLLIFHKKDFEQNGDHPLLFSFSGGMNETYSPSFSVGNIPFIEKGGVIVLASVRGGNESDHVWRNAGLKEYKNMMKQDVKLCLDYLLQERYTSNGKIGIITKHAGTYAAIETVLGNPNMVSMLGIFQGIFDLTGYEKYKGCTSCIEEEFGNPLESKEVFERLKRNSPLLKAYGNYQWPAIYLEHKIIDPVVSPVHSFKFIAALQDNSTNQNSPKLIRIDNECCVQNRRQELFILSERWAFAMQMLGMRLK